MSELARAAARAAHRVPRRRRTLVRVVAAQPRRLSSRVHHERTSTILGIALGVAFTVCFATGLLSHAAQTPIPWFPWPSRPAWLYRVTQGLHVFSGLASIPLLLGKLWAVYPHLWRWPPLHGAAHAVERAALVPLVGGSVFLLVTGVTDIDYWYPYRFFFRTAHFWTAWITAGALVVHIGATATVAASALRDREATAPSTATGLDRRRFLLAVAAAGGAIVLTTVGSAVTPLRRLAVLAPRHPGVGPQGLPVNHQARDVGVPDVRGDPSYRLRVGGRVTRPVELSLQELRARPAHEVELPISCVEGWSFSARWRGVRLRDLLDEAGADPRAGAVVGSLQTRGPYAGARIDAAHAHDPDTLLALAVNGEPLHLDHGFPLRLIAPNSPGVLQTKWVTEVEAL
jgi:DMSO/TMAO reductase YedYZ molybdopterin-dependent catalytic subunit